ncbi:hypothetical protein BDV40DRAFT_283202 [Aspergillus tamarii]|uniref:Transmembrane protein n=1 Tax=Aspergillus tamarii TaxID=41984 RepID=A0A5N6UAP8_ASPTM|nr:hypothetical protein BDV40DRAFT_283202 [Aspergillus tamarii]
MEQEGTIVSTSMAPVDNNRVGEGRLCRRFFGCCWMPIVRRGCLLGLAWFHSVLVLKFAVIIT